MREAGRMTTAAFADFTTLRVGGPIAKLERARHSRELVGLLRRAWEQDEPWMALGGGSNLLASDDGYDGTVVLVETKGIETRRDGDGVVLRVQAGESWDAVVAYSVQRGLAGMEALSGIPGTMGAAPVQNIGAYGQELSDTLVAVELFDATTGEVEQVPAAELELGYRSSALKHGRDAVVTAVEVRLRDDGGRAGPLRYAQLASALGRGQDDAATVREVRDAVLRLRGSKGMVLDPDDPDTRSAGSFFTNPIVDEHVARTLPADAPRFPVAPEPEPLVLPLGSEPVAPPAAPTEVKLSAAWLIERSGVSRGFRLPGSRAAVSSKHTLALTNTGGATAEEVVELARFVQTRVFAEFGVRLQPEPTLLGIQL